MARDFDRTGTLSADWELYGDVLSPGAVAGEYQIEGTISAGGCGTVYYAQHRVLGRRAAVKVLHRKLADSAEMVERFVREARAVNLIRHPNIVDIFDFGKLPDGRPFFVMELLGGTTLKQVAKQQGRMSPALVLELVEPVCAALVAAHAAGIIHRDLKSSNIAVENRPEGRSVKLLDFGIAKLLRPEHAAPGLTTADRRMGTPNAMAPEQIRGGAIDSRTDIYALGVMIYQLLTGQLPFSARDPTELERMHLETPAPRPSAVAPLTPAIDAVVMRCMEKQPERRFESVTALLDALRAAVGGPAALKASAPAPATLFTGIYVEVRLDGSWEEMDDALIGDLGTVLDRAEHVLVGGGYQLALQTSNAILGVRALPSGQEASEAEAARRTAQFVLDGLADRPDAHPRVHVNICTHTAEGVMRGSELVDGPILDIGSWAPQENFEGVCDKTVVTSTDTGG